jgi:hypothetical protein
MDSKSKGTLDNMAKEEEEEHDVKKYKEVVKTSKVLKEMIEVSSNHHLQNEFMCKLWHSM